MITDSMHAHAHTAHHTHLSPLADHSWRASDVTARAQHRNELVLQRLLHDDVVAPLAHALLDTVCNATTRTQ
jgi:hypothetical protein